MCKVSMPSPQLPPVSSPPEAYLEIISSLIDSARNLLERGENLTPIAFVGNITRGEVVPVLMRTATESDKGEAAESIRRIAAMIDADFVFSVFEAWSLRPDKIHQMDAIMSKYGSISASPFAIDCVSLMLETRYGLWSSQERIQPKGYSKLKRTFGKARFRLFKETEGRFAGLLAETSQYAAPETLH